MDLHHLRSALGDRYAIERQLGRGGMSTVFLARDTSRDCPVAIKVLNDELAAALGAERFQREIEIAGRLTHPNIISLSDCGRIGDSLYYVMPYVRGDSLRARLDHRGPLSIADAVSITCEVADALAHAHQSGVIHRDVKPDNILLHDGHALLADFGVARAVAMSADRDHITATGVTVGTPGYMSPEQASADRQVDGRSDQYALACVLYEMLAGQPPFTGPNPQTIIARHAVDSVPPLHTVRRDVPDGVERAMLRALEKSPDERYPTASDFALALHGEYVTAEMARPPLSRIGRVILAHWRVATGAVIGLIVIVTWWAMAR